MSEVRVLPIATSDYSVETERRVERLLEELYDLLQIRKPADLYGSVVIEARYQAGKPSGQVDVNIRYVMKRSAPNGVAVRRRRTT
jgi:hypothetical protein